MNYKSMTKAQLIAHILSLETQTAVQITSCQVYPFKEGTAQGNVRALASIVLNDAIQIRGLRVMNGEHGLYVGFPMDPFYRGSEFRSLCAPVTRAMREAIDVAVLGKYQQVTAESTNG